MVLLAYQIVFLKVLVANCGAKIAMLKLLLAVLDLEVTGY